MAAIHRTAVFTIHQPTRHVRAVLERAFRDYTAAYTEMLHAVRKRYDVDALRGLASYTLPSGTVRQSAQQLKNRLYQDAALPQKSVLPQKSASPARVASNVDRELRAFAARILTRIASEAVI